MKKYILLTPGPANISERVAQAQMNIYTDHRNQDFIDLMQGVRKELVKLAKGNENYSCVLFASSGTGAVEAALTSCIDNSKNILILNNGSYCERMIDILKNYRLSYKSLDYRWGEQFDLNQVEKELKENKEITHIGMVHHETTTGILNPLNKIGQLARQYAKILIVDAISSFIAENIDVINDNIDFCIASSNKGVQATPGIGFIIAKISEIEKLKEKGRNNFYFSLFDQYQNEEKGSPRFTPATQTLHALDEAIKELYEEGVENRRRRYISTANIIRNGIENIGLRLHLPRNILANNITSIDIPTDFPFEKIRDILKTKGYIVRERVKENNTFRIANLGTLTEPEASNFIQSFENILKEIDCKIKYSK